MSGATYFAECVFGQGSFSNAGTVWQWSGTYEDDDGTMVDSEFFQATALESTLSAYETDSDRVAIEIAVTEWAGTFPYSDNYTTSEAVGTGLGYIISTSCPELENTPYLGETGSDN